MKEDHVPSRHLTFAPALLRREDAAEYLAMSPRMLDELQARSEIIPVALGTMKRFRRSDLDELAERLDDWDGDARRVGGGE